MNKPLVIGGSHHNTLSLVRCFGERGVKVDLILYECKNSYIGHSKFIDAVWYCANAIDSVDKAKELVCESPLLYVVFSATDAVASLMDLRYNEFAGKCRFFNAGGVGCLTHYMDKEKQNHLASKAGLLVPKTESFIKGEVLSFDTFPCIIKPLASIDGGKRIIICKNQKEIEDYSNEFADLENVLVQQLIPKEEEIVLLGLAVNGEVIIPGYIIKYRDIKGGTTYSCTAPVSDLSGVLVSKARQMVADIQYEGLFGIELIKSNDDYYFVEINLRNDATSYSLAVAGVNLPWLFFMSCSGSVSIIDASFSVRKLFSMVEINDFRNVLHHKVGFFTWLRQLKSAECRYMYSKEDEEPYRYAKREFIIQMIKKFFY